MSAPTLDAGGAKNLGLDVDAKLLSLSGKRALITGASSGLGKVFAARLFAQGCNVVVAARRTEKLQELTSALHALSSTSPARAVSVQLDVQDTEEHIDAAVQQAWDAFGGLDIIVNNAGYNETPSKPDVKVTYERSEEDWDNVLQTNLRGVGMVIEAAVKRMIPAGRGGSIVNTASIAGIERGVTMGGGIYAASKAGLIQLSKTLALELGCHGIRVNCIAPGLFESEMTVKLWSKIQSRAERVVPLQRWGKVDPDLTGPLMFLASDLSSYVTGTTVIVDGGTSLKRPNVFED